ncbi:LuxR C-terminal-related transcriptional regulator [Pseudoalteromonas phenolica]|uniref:helix-turn-helix transcriptional regulator n=1 Tax=Pseudoalteromonas phenolica TaxID=161398 RepID=UPI00384FF332
MLTFEQELALSEFIAEVYKQATKLEIQAFRQFCFEQLGRFIDFDAGVWLTRRAFDNTFTDSETFQYKLPIGFMENYNKHIAQEKLAQDPVGAYGMKHPNSPVSVFDIWPDRASYHQTTLYQQHCKKYGLEDLLATLYITQHTNIVHILSLYRFHSLIPFSAKEKYIKKILNPHFAEAISINLLQQLKSSDTSEKDHAIADFYGNVLDAEQGFIEQLNACRIDLSKPLFEPVSKEIDGIIHLTENLAIHATVKYNFVFLSLDKVLLPVHCLSERQREICKQLAVGKSDKEIAKALSISPFTVSNHLKRIYTQLNTKNRLETLVLLKREIK